MPRGTNLHIICLQCPQTGRNRNRGNPIFPDPPERLRRQGPQARTHSKVVAKTKAPHHICTCKRTPPSPHFRCSLRTWSPERSWNLPKVTQRTQQVQALSSHFSPKELRRRRRICGSSKHRGLLESGNSGLLQAKSGGSWSPPRAFPPALNISPPSALQLPWASCRGVLSGTHPPQPACSLATAPPSQPGPEGLPVIRVVN